MPKLFIDQKDIMESHCPVCGKDSVKIRGKFNTVNYPAILYKVYAGILPRKELIERLSTYEIVEMVCSECGTRYVVDNRYDLPRVLYPGNIDYFYFMNMWKR